MIKNDTCEHDFKAILVCPKCFAEYEIGMVEIITQAKIDAANQLVQGITKYIEAGEDISSSISKATNDFETHLHNDNAEILFLGTNQKLTITTSN